MRACIALALVCAGCGSTLGAAEAAFDHAELAEARRELVGAEAEYCRFPTAERAEYALYRGLTELGLGHARYAALWLGRAKWWLDHAPELYGVEERGRLLAAWHSLGYMPGEPGALRVGSGCVT